MYAAGSMLTFRYLSEESPLAILMSFIVGIGICGGIITTTFSLFPVSTGLLNVASFLFSPWASVGADYFFWIGVIALCSTLALACMTRAYQITKTSQVAIYEYAYLVSVGISNYVIWDVLPTPLGLFGIVLIVVAGLVISAYRNPSKHGII